MQIFKRILISALCLLCCLSVLSAIIIEPSMVMEATYYSDRNLRRQLSGSVDFIALGASHALVAFDPQILDELLGCNSYNLSGSMMTSYSKYVLLKKELSRNPVKTVILEIAYDTFARNETTEYGVGDSVTLERLDSFPERIAFMTKYIGHEDWLNLYSRSLTDGISCWKRIITGRTASMVDKSAKGFLAKPPVDLTLTPEKAKETYAKRKISTKYDQKIVDTMSEIIRLCRDNGADVIVCVTPLPDSFIWKGFGWDGFRVWLKTYCEEKDCPCYDFNLLKNRYELFHDVESFFDEGHMSSIGAEAFSREFGEVLLKAEKGEDISSLFYDSYSDMIQDSPYLQDSP